MKLMQFHVYALNNMNFKAFRTDFFFVCVDPSLPLCVCACYTLLHSLNGYEHPAMFSPKNYVSFQLFDFSVYTLYRI